MDETIISSIEDIQKSKTEAEPYLVVIAGQNIGKLYDLKKNEVVAGRSPDSEIWIEDSTISRRHFCIKKSGNKYVIEDLDSTNGTFVNNKRVKSLVLNAGDKIQISKDTIIQFDFFDEHRRVSEQKRYEMGVADPVTGAYNKSFFLQRVKEEFSINSRQNVPLSLLMIDIDFFKAINDTYGHLAGDQVLQEISARVRHMIREGDVFCRYGGEEFVLIMRNTECQQAVNLAERIRRKIAESPVGYDSELIKVTVSVGVATAKDKNFRDHIALIAEADKFLYIAKGSGRNKVGASCLPQV